MASYYLSFPVVMALFLLVSSANVPPTPRNQTEDLLVATEEMQRANYFSFVMLIKMAQLDGRFQKNVTFLMPNDRMLSKITMTQDSVTDFLLHHSIPSPLLFDHLEYIPTGSMIPSSAAEYMLRISNHGRRSFLLNSVKLISPNICTAGSSIRCHGVDGVLSAPNTPSPSPPPPCPRSSNPAMAAIPPTPSSDPPTPPPSPSSDPPTPPPSPSSDPPTPPPSPSSDPPTPPPSPSRSFGILDSPPVPLVQPPSPQISGSSSLSLPFVGFLITCILLSMWSALLLGP
ncbi:formin-like protein 3 [Ziziphus jujuba]|uniref:Formin-like protein 3 n=1 Tax=Ziziphus jujuba TaxID=326968 RepID=A0A6P3ZGD4_ZIZJJ|nr:formin-like protein 3 [Ziziphus jujuba]